MVLFDEVDQLVANREHHEEGRDSDKGWIVTALLPKFAELRDQGKIKFILATNADLRKVDPAIMRVGRIDLILPMGGVCWKGRIKMLKEAIDGIESDGLREKLLEEIFRGNSSKLFSIYFKKPVDSNKTPEVKQKEEDDFFKSLKSSRVTSRSHPSLFCFLDRTNYMSQPLLRLLLQKAFDSKRTDEDKTGKEISEENIFEDPEYTDLFGCDRGLNYEPFRDDLFVEFHNKLINNVPGDQDFVRTHIRLPKLPHNKSLFVIAKENVHPEQV